MFLERARENWPWSNSSIYLTLPSLAPVGNVHRTINSDLIWNPYFFNNKSAKEGGLCILWLLTDAIKNPGTFYINAPLFLDCLPVVFMLVTFLLLWLQLKALHLEIKAE
jgi:hypothetical protein